MKPFLSLAELTEDTEKGGWGPLPSSLYELRRISREKKPGGQNHASRKGAKKVKGEIEVSFADKNLLNHFSDLQGPDFGFRCGAAPTIGFLGAFASWPVP
jgi:hypothetical protein